MFIDGDPDIQILRDPPTIDRSFGVSAPLLSVLRTPLPFTYLRILQSLTFTDVMCMCVRCGSTRLGGGVSVHV